MRKRKTPPMIHHVKSMAGSATVASVDVGDGDGDGEGEGVGVPLSTTPVNMTPGRDIFNLRQAYFLDAARNNTVVTTTDAIAMKNGSAGMWPPSGIVVEGVATATFCASREPAHGFSSVSSGSIA